MAKWQNTFKIGHVTIELSKARTKYSIRYRPSKFELSGLSADEVFDTLEEDIELFHKLSRMETKIYLRQKKTRASSKELAREMNVSVSYIEKQFEKIRKKQMGLTEEESAASL